MDKVKYCWLDLEIKFVKLIQKIACLNNVLVGPEKLLIFKHCI
jgi:hypothetical protein